jgi:formiminotetrahydrofolate cyclodeaminase
MLVNMTIRNFTDEVASCSPAPGGGSVSALAGAQAAALLSMYCNLTIGKEKYAAMREIMEDALAEAARLHQELLSAVDDDTRAFEQVMAAFQLPRGTAGEKETRREAVQAALKEAARVPFRVCLCCHRLLHLVAGVAGKGNESALSDIGVANLQAYAGLTGAAYNVLINLGSIQDGEFISHHGEKLRNIRESGAGHYNLTVKRLEETL